MDCVWGGSTLKSWDSEIDWSRWGPPSMAPSPATLGTDPGTAHVSANRETSLPSPACAAQAWQLVLLTAPTPWEPCSVSKPGFLLSPQHWGHQAFWRQVLSGRSGHGVIQVALEATCSSFPVGLGAARVGDGPFPGHLGTTSAPTRQAPMGKVTSHSAIQEQGSCHRVWLWAGYFGATRCGRQEDFMSCLSLSCVSCPFKSAKLRVGA